MKMTLWFSHIVSVPALMLLLSACDNRGSIDRSKPAPSFSGDLTVVRDLSQERNVAQILFKRDGQPFDGATVQIGNITIPSAGNGRYVAQSPNLTLFPRINQITFESADDNYLKTLTFDLPDTFSIASVDPAYNPGVVDVNVVWTKPGGATSFALVVVARNYPANGTAPLRVLMSADITSYVVPDTTFEDATGNTVSDAYLIYVVAFNQGFGSYPGLMFPLPDSLPQRRVSDPAGYFRYGTVAPADSIVVPL